MGFEKILVVDDEESISAYLQKKLSKLGYSVSVANDGEDALNKAASILPDVLLLDVKMPKLDGLVVCWRLKSDEKTKHIKVIILSAKAQTFEIEQGLQAGADSYLCKPASFPDILNMIKSLEIKT